VSDEDLEPGGRHSADDTDDIADDTADHTAGEPRDGAVASPAPEFTPEYTVTESAEDELFRRPDGLAASFAANPEPPSYSAPPPTVAPDEIDVFGRPAGAGAYLPRPGDRVPPRQVPPPAVPWAMTQAFAATPSAEDGFAPAPGTRIDPSGPPPESPWWKRDASRDPWRDPSAPYWLGRGAVFAAGQPAQLDPTQDVEQDLDEAEAEPDEDENVVPISSGRARFGMRAIVLSVLIALIAGAIGGFGGYFLGHRTGDALHRSDVALSQVDPATDRPPASVAGIAKRVGPAVVSLAVSNSDGSIHGVGSGVVIDKHGYVLTNNHVAAVAKDGGSIIATFSDEATARAQIVGLDPVSDLAVLKVPDDQLTVATLGKSAGLAVGDPVIAIGSPLGLEGTVTAGIVSALHRPVHVFGEDGTSDAYLDAIQTDAAINPGNSGGALVDGRGALVGINSAAALSATGGATTSGIGYAIPIDYARKIALELIQDGKATHGSLDAQGRTAQAGLQSGAYLEQVVPKGAAAKAGLQNGDVIVVADGQSIQSYDQLVVIVQEHDPGTRIDVTYFRGSHQHTATVTLGSA
jgi:S1-C subfamily serine protease